MAAKPTKKKPAQNTGVLSRKKAEGPTLGSIVKERLYHGKPPKKGTDEWAVLCGAVQTIAAEHGSQCCLGKTRGGWPCTNSILGTGNRCKMHGGAGSGPGPGHPAFKHGRTSYIADKLPERFREAFGKFVDDPELLSLRPEIAVVDSRFYELLEKLDTGESATAWEAAGQVVTDLLATLQEQDPDMDAVVDMAKILQARVFAAKRYGSLWAELQGVSKVRKDLVETESKRLKEAGAVMNAVDVLGIVHRMMDIFFRHILDKKVLQSVLDEVDRSGLLPSVPKLPPTSSAKS